MSGEASIDVRLSPSGPNVTDAGTNAPLQTGFGTPGLVWRGDYAPGGPPIDIGGATPINLPGMGGAWDLPVGYNYYVETFLSVYSLPGGVNYVIITVEGSTDGGVTYPIVFFANTLPATVMAAQETLCFQQGVIDALGGLPITHIRTRACRGGSAGDNFAVADSIA